MKLTNQFDGVWKLAPERRKVSVDPILLFAALAACWLALLALIL